MHNTVEVQIHLDNTKARLTASIGVIVRGWIYNICRRRRRKECFNSWERIKYRTGYSLYQFDIDNDFGGDCTWSTEEVAVVDCVPTES